MTDKIRSVIFNIFYIFGSLIVSILLMWAWFLPVKKCAAVVGDIYGGYMSFIERYILGLKLEIRGLENLPKEGAYIIAAKHQSAYETLNVPFMKQFGYPAIILKKELVYLPIWGIYTLRMGEIPINRSEGAKALSSMIKGCKRALEGGRNIMIFPQGTRVPVGKKIAYKAGLAKVYKDVQVPIVPMALNSGVFWGKNKFFKKSGTVVFEFLPAIPPGIPPLKMMGQLEEHLEAATDKLVAEAQASLKK